MIDRIARKHALQLAAWFPVLAITGPRQSGKTTLAKAAFPDYEYVNLERAPLLTQARDDPQGFIENRPRRLVIDEAQLAPGLFSAVQVASDEAGEPGQYILSGSQNFLLSSKIRQSLAGRCAYIDLLPLSFAELAHNGTATSLYDFAFSGGYPRIYNSKIPAPTYYRNYVRTYLERDVEGFLDVRRLADYERMLKSCAWQAGNLLNLSKLAKDCGITFNTAKSWLSMLESSYVAFRLLPYHASAKKRLTKTPKLYFHDTGLLCHLMGIKSVDELKTHPRKGAVIENLVVAETLKGHLNAGEDPELYFYRDDSKIEIDLLDFTQQDDKRAYEVKASGMYRESYARSLLSTAESLGVPPESRAVLLDVEHSYNASNCRAASLGEYLLEVGEQPG